MQITLFTCPNYLWRPTFSVQENDEDSAPTSVAPFLRKKNLAFSSAPVVSGREKVETLIHLDWELKETS
jgi:hypothetical protein